MHLRQKRHILDIKTYSFCVHLRGCMILKTDRSLKKKKIKRINLKQDTFKEYNNQRDKFDLFHSLLLALLSKTLVGVVKWGKKKNKKHLNGVTKIK